MLERCYVGSLGSRARHRQPFRYYGVATAACLSVAVAVWFFCEFRLSANNETSYRHAVRNMRLAGKLRRPCERLPKLLRRPIDDLLIKQFRNYDAVEAKLLASGFLTNASITLTHASALFSGDLRESNMVEHAILEGKMEGLDALTRCLQNVVGRDSFLPFILLNKDREKLVIVCITCRTCEVPLVRKALENY